MGLVVLSSAYILLALPQLYLDIFKLSDFFRIKWGSPVLRWDGTLGSDVTLQVVEVFINIRCRTINVEAKLSILGSALPSRL